MSGTVTVQDKRPRVTVRDPHNRVTVRTGPAGPAGRGVPPGGTAGQVLTKTSATDFEADWADAAASGDATVYRRTFTQSDLVGGVLYVDHGFGEEPGAVMIYDANGDGVSPDRVSHHSANQARVTLSSLAPITGTWKAIAVGG